MTVVAWLLGVVAAVGALFGAAVGGLVGDELKGWLRRIPFALLWLAARRADGTDLYADWRADLEAELRERSNMPITQLVFGIRFACGLLWAGRRATIQRPDAVAKPEETMRTSEVWLLLPSDHPAWLRKAAKEYARTNNEQDRRRGVVSLSAAMLQSILSRDTQGG